MGSHPVVGVAVARITARGVAGLPDIDLDLGPMTALVGPRGSGKSQLLRAIAWALGEPAGLGFRPADPSRLVAGKAVAITLTGPVRTLAERDAEGRLRWREGPSTSRLPAVSYLRASDRLAPRAAGRASVAGGGSVASGLAERFDHLTTDAAAAEDLVGAVEACCVDGIAGEVLLIEEPELQLIPQAQRYLYTLLRRFADGGNQVVYSTRSPAFVDAAHHDEIVRLDLRAAGTVVRRTQPDTLSDRERLRLAAEFDHERSEMFFARVAVLVEGRTERLSLPFIFRALGHDPDAMGIAIVEVGGKSNLPLAASVLNQLEIPFVLVFDADRGGADALEAAIRRSAAGRPVVRLEPDFEAAAGIRSHDDKVFAAWQRFARAGSAAVPPELAAIVHAAVDLIA